MKSIRSLFYREMRLSARHYMIRLLLLVLVVGFAALSLLVTGQNSAYAGEDMSGFTVMLTYIIAVIAGVVISEDNGVFKADMDAGWLRYSYALPMSAAKKALTRTLVKLLSVVVGMVVIVAGAAAVRGMNGSSLDLKTILYFVLILDVFLLYDMVQQIFILGSAFEGAYNIGDRIEIQSGDISQSYEVTGFVQSVNYQGNVCEFSLEGYEALNSETFLPTLYVYLNDAADTEKIIDEIEQSY
ncbi:MAG: hypothetical protein J6A16_02605, partial [Oscillospiraceae bacterium]|nr:hypothetical protein [Oscillospiraceae bacterium]